MMVSHCSRGAMTGSVPDMDTLFHIPSLWSCGLWLSWHAREVFFFYLWSSLVPYLIHTLLLSTTPTPSSFVLYHS